MQYLGPSRLSPWAVLGLNLIHCQCIHIVLYSYSIVTLEPARVAYDVSCKCSYRVSLKVLSTSSFAHVYSECTTTSEITSVPGRALPVARRLRTAEVPERLVRRKSMVAATLDVAGNEVKAGKEAVSHVLKVGFLLEQGVRGRMHVTYRQADDHRQ